MEIERFNFFKFLSTHFIIFETKYWVLGIIIYVILIFIFFSTITPVQSFFGSLRLSLIIKNNFFKVGERVSDKIVSFDIIWSWSLYDHSWVYVLLKFSKVFLNALFYQSQLYNLHQSASCLHCFYHDSSYPIPSWRFELHPIMIKNPL